MYVKIGYSNKPNQRIKDLQCGSPSEYKIEAIVFGDRKDEYSLHSRFKKYLFRNEWFFLTNELREYIVLCRENNALIPERPYTLISLKKRETVEEYINKCMSELVSKNKEVFRSFTNPEHLRLSELVMEYQILGSIDNFYKRYYHIFYPCEMTKSFQAERGEVVTIYYD
ncbi:GIY-YIG nuclease family protein [Paenibacillus elgii]|nr:GIY-YIG nuclease family protein [Paenibacillus elgii]MCM3273986.1 GIY-YIG nuclease family protein [Paenibacillus elgii]